MARKLLVPVPDASKQVNTRSDLLLAALKHYSFLVIDGLIHVLQIPMQGLPKGLEDPPKPVLLIVLWIRETVELLKEAALSKAEALLNEIHAKGHVIGDTKASNFVVRYAPCLA